MSTSVFITIVLCKTGSWNCSLSEGSDDRSGVLSCSYEPVVFVDTMLGFVVKTFPQVRDQMIAQEYSVVPCCSHYLFLIVRKLFGPTIASHMSTLYQSTCFHRRIGAKRDALRGQIVRAYLVWFVYRLLFSTLHLPLSTRDPRLIICLG